ncbi:hypothetical protein CVT24_003726 [Panaeolus cyanescens]|uniref:ATP-dependent DNA helicase n=1 Tax=Panaeolus cyanescens TaxID=181874 RepID=A0A409W8D1_9AGAR|nr:hypothetical protein CVT24_003726 [Panaeolus cyanescens]
MFTVNLSVLTVAHLKSIARQNGITIPRHIPNVKSRIVEHIQQHASRDAMAVFEQEVLEAVSRRNNDTVTAHTKRTKRQNLAHQLDSDEDEEDYGTQHLGPHPRIETFQPVKDRDDYNTSKFLDLPTEDEVKECNRDFFNTTSQNAVKLTVCAVCAREVGVVSEEVQQLSLENIPNLQRLKPRTSHPAHTLFNGALFEPAGVEVDPRTGSYWVRICRQCLRSLQSSKDLPPVISLANNMWIGNVPEEISCLTFPEQLLITPVYTRAYVFKLYPKKGFGGDSSMLQRALRGTVSSFSVDMHGITDMLEGNLMPRRPAVLASLVSIAFIGPGKLPKNILRKLFRVRRAKVLAALLWLKKNNPKYYGHIEIDEECLRMIPEDDVPDELLSIVRQSVDGEIVDQERAGYVPDHELSDDDEELDAADDIPYVRKADTNVSIVDEATDSDSEDERQLERQDKLKDITEQTGEPEVFPLQVTGSIDVDLTTLSANELMAWGLANLWSEGQEGAYAVRHGNGFVRDFSQPRLGEERDPDRDIFIEKAFPTLFPFGVGGIEADRPVKISMKEHVQWALCYFDRRFRLHEQFIFVAFSILQRRQALLSARIQMRRPQFEREAHLIGTITAAKLRKAQEEEEKGLPISDPAVRLLQRSVYATASRVKGSNQERMQLRTQIWSTCIMKNPASLWITINPTDIHDPIAQIFAGESINLDNFVATMGPSSDKRAQNISRDPYASAKFFHFTIKAIMETLFGVKTTDYHVFNKPGIMGRVSAFFGTVESQGRGSLHFHLLLWLEDAPTADEMNELLRIEEFRNKVATYIQKNLRAYMPGLESADTVKSIPREKDIAYSRPINPDVVDYNERLADFELRLARSEQIHTCRHRQCLFPNKQGTYQCKRRAPFAISETDGIDEKGNWWQKRLYGYVNGWIPGILVNVRCNNDGKLLTHGSDTKNISRYTTTYAAKKQGKNYNASAIMAKAYGYHIDRLSHGEDTDNYIANIRDIQRMLIFRLVHAMNREQEFAAPMIVSYLMEWGDCYRSHRYDPIFWSSFVYALNRAFPELQNRKPSNPDDHDAMKNRSIGDSNNRENNGVEMPEEKNKDDTMDSDGDNQTLTMDFNSVGMMFAKSQVTDYRLRGDPLESYNIIQFFTNTYETRRKKNRTRNLVNLHQEDADTDDAGTSDAEEHSESIKAGRPMNERVPYLDEHPKAETKWRVIRSKGHNHLPNFIGQQFAQSDDPDTYDFYCASMLMLLKPWRDLQSDLKRRDQTWIEAFREFLENASKETKAIISGIKFLSDCETAAKEDRKRNGDSDGNGKGRRRRWDMEEDLMGDAGEDLGEDLYPTATEAMEENLEFVLKAQTSYNEEMHGRLAIEIAKRLKIFHEEEQGKQWDIRTDDKVVSNASGDDLARLTQWCLQMEAEVAKINGDENSSQQSDGRLRRHEVSSRMERDGEVVPIHQLMDEERDRSTIQEEPSDQYDTINATDPSSLNNEQRRAYDIILWHLDQTISGHNPPPLRMIIHGEGGTGKSKVLQTVTQAFKKQGCAHMLIKAAYTGVAASLIEGKTTHTVGNISARAKDNDYVSDETKSKLEKIWETYTYLAIDEISMISKDFLALLSRNIGIGKRNTEQSFGAINVILLGDFHQFPPVARPIRDALYYPINQEIDTLTSQIGRAIYEEFRTVVLLKEQRRVSDPVWLDFLQHLRRGEVQAHHLTMLEGLVLGGPKKVDFTKDPWRNASLVTPRHAVRRQWNDAALREMCQEKHRQIFVCTAEDTIKGRQISARERIILEAHRGRRKSKTKDLPFRIEMALGMKVMVTDNIETDLDITNGARGEIVDIVLHPDEPPFDKEQAIVKLKYPPAYILVKMSRTRLTRLEGLEETVIPVVPTSTTYRIKIAIGGKEVQRTVKRKQFPMTAAYAFTDYRSQGQTIPYVLVDIATPPSGTLTLFNLYVALSRSSGRQSIRLLRDFDHEMFLKKHDVALVQEDERLEVLDEVTRRWYNEVVLQNRDG